jgi:hypothetical protein
MQGRACLMLWLWLRPKLRELHTIRLFSIRTALHFTASLSWCIYFQVNMFDSSPNFYAPIIQSLSIPPTRSVGNLEIRSPTGGNGAGGLRYRPAATSALAKGRPPKSVSCSQNRIGQKLSILDFVSRNGYTVFVFNCAMSNWFSSS